MRPLLNRQPATWVRSILDDQPTYWMVEACTTADGWSHTAFNFL